MLHKKTKCGMRGKLEVSIELIPKVLAKDRPAGRGRDEPNTNPVRPLLLLLLLSLSLSVSVVVCVHRIIRIFFN